MLFNALPPLTVQLKGFAISVCKLINNARKQGMKTIENSFVKIKKSLTLPTQTTLTTTAARNPCHQHYGKGRQQHRWAQHDRHSPSSRSRESLTTVQVLIPMATTGMPQLSHPPTGSGEADWFHHTNLQVAVPGKAGCPLRIPDGGRRATRWERPCWSTP